MGGLRGGRTLYRGRRPPPRPAGQDAPVCDHPFEEQIAQCRLSEKRTMAGEAHADESWGRSRSGIPDTARPRSSPVQSLLQGRVWRVCASRLHSHRRRSSARQRGSGNPGLSVGAGSCRAKMRGVAVGDSSSGIADWGLDRSRVRCVLPAVS